MDSPKRKIYPPVWLAFCLLTMIAIDHFVTPLSQSPAALRYLGVAIICSGVGLAAWAGGGFRKAGTDMVPFKNVTALVTDGVYRYSRNPMYLGMALLLLGTVLLLGSVLSTIVIPCFMIIIQRRFIEPEERMLHKLFADDYANYCARVRRWL